MADSPPAVTARLFEEADTEQWDALVARSWNGTLLHTRRFLSYHGARFEDRSLIFELDGRPVGVMPAAVDPGDPSAVISHPGSTYGGIVTGRLRGDEMSQAVSAAASAYSALGYGRLCYRPVPPCFHSIPIQDDLYVLWRSGARVIRTDLWALVPATRSARPSRVRRRALARADAAGLRVEASGGWLATFWSALDENLARRHGVRPTHTLDEITLLQTRFPEDIQVRAALEDSGRLLAGAVIFKTPAAWHVQYSSSTDLGREVGALDLVYESIITDAQAQGRETSFGASTESGGAVLNSSLYLYKLTFGAGSYAHQFFELEV